MKSNRRKGMIRIGSLLAATSLAITMTSCSSEDEDATIVWEMWGGGESDIANSEEQARLAQEANPDLDVELSMTPYDGYFPKLTAGMSAGELSCILTMNGQSMADYHEAFSPLSAEDLKLAGIVEEEFTANSFDLMRIDGELYGVPWDVATMVVFANEDALSEAGAELPGLDWDFNDFDALLEDAKGGEMMATVVETGDLHWQSLPISRSGQQPVTEDFKLDMTDPKFAESVNWYGSLVTDGYAAAIPSAAESGWGAAQFTTEKAATTIDGTWNALNFLNNEAGFDLGVRPVPAGPNGSLSIMMGSGYGISSTCENREDALKVLGSLVGEEAQNSIAESGRSLPARLSSQEIYYESIPEPGRTEIKNAFEAAFSNAESWRTSPDWQQLVTAMQSDLVSVYNGQKTMDDFLTQMQERFGQS